MNPPGLSRQKWLRDGKPAYPGRLNDLLHIVYCSGGKTLGARDCAVMLRQGLTKENIDGEALAWAATRLRRCKERRKILIVLSDRAPVDDSTLLENGDEYLSRHLRTIAGEIEQADDIRLVAIGIGHATAPYYQQGITISSPDELESTLLQLIEQLLDRPC
ncbi:cobaltochelatase CobT-related protein [Bradyrhizobium sp. SZCCHNRI3043]|uniref:cobaltochelatase CobT-related protein n=1 Tax=Bradyrhizobium sp. SZCCHNRI3043 TaxID=3057292 RepID=UPI0028EEFE16|nr:hypothetical protein [Bradyrhizobium sp. SZCCHNRI3043]